MPLNIKSERVSQLARELAEQTGVSITDAVAEAIEARLTVLRRRKSREGLADRLMEMSHRAAAMAPPDWLKRDLDKELYDEKGLPR